MPPLKDRTGERYGSLTVIKRSEDKITPGGQRLTSWLCKCDCGNEITVLGCNLNSGHTKSCGCYSVQHPSATKHGLMRKHQRLYNIWCNMKQRCNDANHKSYANYGGRGIKVCDEWNDFGKFCAWAILNGYDENAPYGECTLDRINVNGDYEPSNCRWANMLIQRHNQRRLCDWQNLRGLHHTLQGL